MASGVSAILLDAGGVLVFPRPDHVRAGLRAIGLDPDLATLERAHYQAMAAQDAELQPPAPGTWWRNYLMTYIAECGVPAAECEPLAAEIAERPGRAAGPTPGWGSRTACGPWPRSACRWASSPTPTAA